MAEIKQGYKQSRKYFKFKITTPILKEQVYVDDTNKLVNL